jgi:hypothetical protein
MLGSCEYFSDKGRLTRSRKMRSREVNEKPTGHARLRLQTELVKAAAQAGDNIRRVPTGAAFPAREVLEGVVQIVCPYIGRSADEGCAIKFWEAHMASARPAAFLFDLDACRQRVRTG